MLPSRRLVRTAYASIDSAACLRCQWRSFTSSYILQADPQSQPSPSPLEDAPRASGKAVTEFTPKPLSRPIGITTPPHPSENTGIDYRSWKQRRDDFVDYDKHLARRKQLTKKMATPYFREWSNMKLHKGKSFLANPRLFKSDRALFFPNMYGQTLVKDELPSSTTPILEGRVSLISIFSGQWAANQAATFFPDTSSNIELKKVIDENKDIAQHVQINVEENPLKAWIIKLFVSGLRKQNAKENWGKYFMVRKGLPDETRDAIGLLNSKVGYTYLLDGECRIRWAGSGNAEGDERQGLARGMKRLIEEARSTQKTKTPEKKKPSSEQEKKEYIEERVGLVGDDKIASTVAS